MPNEADAEYHYWRANDLASEDRPREAISHLEATLEHEPEHVEGLILMGELYLWDAAALGLSEDDAHPRALQLFERALGVEPRQADAWSLKARVLLYLNRPAEALNAADAGLVVLPERVGYAMTYSPVYTNVAESLFDAKVQALLELGRGPEAAAALTAGFDHCPGSEYLSRNIDFVTRVALPPDPDDSS